MSRVLGVQRGGLFSEASPDKQTVIDVIKTVIGYGKVELSQDRLAEILVAMLNATGSTPGGGGSTPSPTTVSASYVGYVLTITVNGVSVSLPINPVIGGTLYQYDTGVGMYVRATGLGITTSKLNGVYTMTIPNNVIVQSCGLYGRSADLSPTNDITIVFNNLEGTTFIGDVFVPVITLYDRILNDPPTDPIPWIYNISNSPQYQITNIGNKTLSIRIINMDAYLNWGIKLNF